MYQPDHFRVDDVPQMHALMRARPFAALVSGVAGGINASHLPTVLKADGQYGVIECHLARPNPHWKDLAKGNEALLLPSLALTGTMSANLKSCATRSANEQLAL